MNDEPFDTARFDAWIAADPRHKALFDTMWRRVMGPDMDAALQAYGHRRRARKHMLAGGAAAVLAMLGGYQALPSIELFLTEPRIYAASDNSIRKVRLQDGTQLTLAGGANVHIRYTRHAREIELTRGTMFADVAHDKGRPFRIEAGAGEVTVLGTRFELSKKSSTIRVTVESGHVRFGRNGWFNTPISLVAEESATLAGESLKRQDHTGGIARWRSEWVEYHEAPLREVVADLESVSPLPIRISGDALAAKRVSGRIRLIDPVKQIENLSIIHNFSVKKNDYYIIVSNRNSER